MCAPAVSRRQGLGALAAVAALWGGVKLRFAKATGLRPPMALPPGEFERACIRCFRCGEVCPVKCIQFGLGTSLLDMDTPRIDASKSACTLCMRCTQVCPTGALQPTPAQLEPLQQLVRMGTPVLDKNACLTWSKQGVCRLCYYVCPYPDSAVSLLGPGLGPLFHPDACVGCGLCEEACPQDAHAIVIVPMGAPKT